MASVNNFLKPIVTDSSMRDFKHASRTFVDNNYELQPRSSHLFHVVFNFMPEAATLFDTITKLEIPILVKSIDLPQYSIDVQTHNQYNRKVQSHHGMQYQPINATFHDDSKDLIRNLWHTYYTFYNADATYDLNSNAYNAYDKYSDRTQQQWGFQRGNKRFFKNIKIYSMQNHKFAEYTLVNPIITSFGHDTHAYANSGFMQHQVQFAYETVKYATGYVNNVTPKGFGDIHYDVERSDIEPTNSENTAFVNGSVVNVAGQEPADLFQGNLIGTIKDADIIFGNNKQTLTGNVLQDTFNILANNAITGQKLDTNILVPLIGYGEQEVTSASKTITDNIANTVTGVFNNKVSSQGVDVTSVAYTDSSSNSIDLGYATNVIRQNATISNPNNISDTTKSAVTVYNTKAKKEIELASRLNDQSISESEKESIRNRLDGMKRG